MPEITRSSKGTENGTLKWITTMVSLAVLVASLSFGYGMLAAGQARNTDRVTKAEIALLLVQSELGVIQKGQSRIEQKLDSLIDALNRLDNKRQP